MKKIALIGAGFIGTVHSKNLFQHRRVHFSHVYDVDSTRAQAIAQLYGAESASLDDILHSDVDALLIASATNTHADIVEVASRHGKAVLCEKPIDLDLSRVRDTCHTVQKSGIRNMVDFNRRFDASHRALRDAIVRGDIGAVEIIHITARDPAPPPIDYIKVSGGQMRDQAVHFFDLLRWISRDEPVELYGLGSCLVDKAIEVAGDTDTAVISLRMASGALAQIDCSRRTNYGYDERIEVFGAEGMIESSRQQHRHVSLYKQRHIHQDGMYEGWFERMKPTYYQSLDAFVRYLEGEALAVPSFEDGLKAQIIADTACKSIEVSKPLSIHYE